MTNGQKLDQLKTDLMALLNRLPLRSMYQDPDGQQPYSVEKGLEHAQFIGEVLCVLSNGLARIGVDPSAIALSLIITGRLGRQELQESGRWNGPDPDTLPVELLSLLANSERPTPQTTAKKPFVSYGNSTLN